MLVYLGRQVSEGLEGSGVGWCRFWRRVPEVPETSGVPEGSEKFRRFGRVLV